MRLRSAAARTAFFGRDNFDSVFLSHELFECLAIAEAQRLITIAKHIEILFGVIPQSLDLHRYSVVIEQYLEARKLIEVIDGPMPSPF